MAESFYRPFAWSVSLVGYYWEEEEKVGPDQKTLPVLKWDRNAQVRPYSPLIEETGLFLTLAETPPEPEAMIAFANRYGTLGHGIQTRRKPKRTETTGFIHLGVEPQIAWIAAIRWLNHLVRLWRAATAEDVQALSEFVTWDDWHVTTRGFPEGAEHLLLEPVSRLIYARPEQVCNFQGSDDVERGDTAAATFHILGGLLDEMLKSLVVPHLVWNPKTRKSVLSFKVSSLWGAILLQFAEALSGQHEYQRCMVCSRWFELGPGANRADKLTCSDSCRQKHYRLRKERAVELHAQGKTPREIAKEIGSDVETVKGWIQRRKGK